MTPATAPELAAELKRLDLLPAAAPDPGPGPAEPFARELAARGLLTQFQLDAVLRGKAARLRVGPYRLLDRLGDGGMGQVFRARHSYLGSDVALKLIRRDLAGSAVATRRFLREIRQAGRLVHPHVVRALDANQADGSLFLVTELVAGTTLADLVSRTGRLAEPDACRAAADAARGLAAIHAAGLTHRDVKPSNLIRVAADGAVKVLDLGLAGLAARPAAAESASLTMAGQLIGTPDYMAPEQARDARQADPRADLYSLGCTLFHLLTGQPPFAGRLPMDVLVAHLTEPPPDLLAVRPETTPAVGWLVGRLLAKNPDDRPQSADEVAAELDDLLATWATPSPFRLDDPPPVPAAVPTPPPSTQVRPRRWPLAVAVGAAGLAVVAVGWAAFRPSPAATSTPTPTPPSTVVTAAAPEDELRQLRATDPTKFRAAAYAIADRHPGTPTAAAVAALLRRSSSPHDSLRAGPDGVIGRIGPAVPRHAGAATRLAVSPDGKTVASVGNDAAVKLWDAATGRLLRTLTGHRDQLHAVAFSPDGRHVAAASGLRSRDETEGFERQARVWVTATGEPVRTFGTDRGQDWVISLAYSPDGRTVATGRYDGWRLRAVADGAVLKAVDAPTNWVMWLAFLPDGRSLVTLTNDRKLRVWDAATGRERRGWTACDWFPTGLAVTADGGRAAVVGAGRVRVWNLADGSAAADCPLTPEPLAAAFCPDGKELAVGLADGSLAWLDAGTGAELARTPGHPGGVTHVVWPTAGRALSTGADGLVRRWDAALRTEIAPPAADPPATSLAFADQDRKLVVARPGRPAEVWDIATLTREAVLPIGAAGGPVAVAAGGKRVAAADDGGKVRVWDAARPTVTTVEVSGASARPARLGWAADSRHLVVAFPAEADGLAVIDADSNRVVHRLAPGPAGPGAVAASRDARVVAAAGDDRRVRVWDNGRLMLTLHPPDPVHTAGPARAVTVRPDGGRVEVCGWSADPVEFAVPAGGPVRSGWAVPAGWAFGTAVAPDARTRAVWTGDGTIHLPATDGRPARTVAAVGRPTAAALSADGRLLATADADAGVTLFKVGP